MGEFWNNVSGNVIVELAVAALLAVAGLIARFWSPAHAWMSERPWAVAGLIGGFAGLLTSGIASSFNGQATFIPDGTVVAFDHRDGCPDGEGWTEFTAAHGRFILGVDGSEYTLPYVGGEPDYQTAGEAKHELKLIEIPRHGHRISTDEHDQAETDFIHNGLAGGGANIGILSIFKELPNLPSHPRALPDVLEKTGGMADGKAQPHNNMPPYIALYFCKYVGTG